MADKKIKLNIPMMSAGMDTVTEHRMAMRHGKTGWYRYHSQNMSIEAQAEEVDKVKRSENGVITDPFSCLLSTSGRRRCSDGEVPYLRCAYHRGQKIGRHHHQP